jgi:hypothetical protein
MTPPDTCTEATWRHASLDSSPTRWSTWIFIDVFAFFFDLFFNILKTNNTFYTVICGFFLFISPSFKTAQTKRRRAQTKRRKQRGHRFT